MDHDEFDSVSWGDPANNNTSSRPTNPDPPRVEDDAGTGKQPMANHPASPQAGANADPLDLAGVGGGRLECTVDAPQKENEGTKDAFISYKVTTETDFPSFQKPTSVVRRRFTDFLFLYKTLFKEYPACAVPPLPDKHKLEYVRGDRFGPDFTNRRAHSLHRFLKRLAMHPVLRRSPLLIIFLESPDWNAHMRMRPQRTSTLSASDASSNNGGGGGGGGVFDNFTDTFLNAFSKVHKPDKRFIEVLDKSNRLDEDLGHVEKIVARVARRQADLETDYSDLSTQFQKLISLEPGVEGAIHLFARSVEDSSTGWKHLKEHTDQNYLGSLRDMEAYIVAIKSLLKVREQKQLDFEALTDYRNKAASERDTLASAHPPISLPLSSSSNTGGGGAAGSSSSAHTYHYSSPATSATAGVSSFFRSKIEDVRGVDHESSRRERVRRLELRIDELSREVETAKLTTEAFDEEVVKEVADFERIKAAEFRDTLGELAEKNVEFYRGVRDGWEKFIVELERDAQGGKTAD